MGKEVRKRNMAVAGGDISVLNRRAGDDLILFVHGLGCVKECFLDAWAIDSLADYSLLAPDLPGNGDSPAAGFSCTMEDYGKVLTELLGAYSYTRLHVVAHSMGGAPALLLARDRNLPLVTFVCVEGNLVSSDCGLVSRRAAATPEAAFLGGKFARLRARVAASDEPGLRLWGPWLARSDPRAFHRCCRSLVDWSDGGDLLRIYRALPVSRFYVCGAWSKVPQTLARLAGEDVTEIPDCGHFPMNERPEIFYSLIAQILGKVH